MGPLGCGHSAELKMAKPLFLATEKLCTTWVSDDISCPRLVRSKSIATPALPAAISQFVPGRSIGPLAPKSESLSLSAAQADGVNQSVTAALLERRSTLSPHAVAPSQVPLAVTT